MKTARRSLRRVALSALLPANHDEQWFEREKFLAAYQQLIAGKKSVEDLFANIDKEFAEFAPVMKLATPSKSLSRHLVEAAVAQA